MVPFRLPVLQQYRTDPRQMPGVFVAAGLEPRSDSELPGVVFLVPIEEVQDAVKIAAFLLADAQALSLNRVAESDKDK
eukprot:scaffold1090_cov265-Pinguiococcus_pyrenoidosus.AAC.19